MYLIPCFTQAEQRREICLAIQNECKIQQSTNEELKGLLLRMQKAQEVWLNDQKVSLDKLVRISLLITLV